MFDVDILLFILLWDTGIALLLFNSAFILKFKATVSSVSLDKYSSNLAVSLAISSMQLNSDEFSSCSFDPDLKPSNPDYRILPMMLAMLSRLNFSIPWNLPMMVMIISVKWANALTAFSFWLISSYNFALYVANCSLSFEI